MKTISIFIMIIVSCISFAGKPQMEQVFQLHPGWNAVFLEVNPDAANMDSLFQGIPLASVWAFDSSFSSREFVREQSEELVNRPEWHVHFPASREESLLNDLFRLQANHAYLVKIDGLNTVDWHVTGTPSLHYPDWVSNAYNLTGFPVDPVAPADFETFLSSSPAHAGQPIFRLDPSGQWQEIINPGSTLMETGTAYWIYTRGTSVFRAPLSLEMADPHGLYFESGIDKLSLVVRNQDELSGGISLSFLSSGDSLPLKYWKIDSVLNEVNWTDLPLSFTTAPETPLILWLAASRKDFTQDELAGILEVSDGAGTRWMVPAHAFKNAVTGANKAAASSPYQGLWVGPETVNGVSEAFSTTPEVEQPTINDFSYRIMFHVDSAGRTRLLKEVTLMFEEGATETEDGRYVLITDPSLLQDYHGATMVDGESVGYRISCLAYDFVGMEHDMDGDFGWVDAGSGPVPGTPLTTELVLGVDDVTNPFKHRYHPDHDNKTADFEDFKAEAYEIRRNMTFEFNQDDPDGKNSPVWGSTEMGGHYSETLDGLFAKTIPGGGGALNTLIRINGIFKVKRISSEGVINE
jgi:hypothetical protein